MGQAGLELEADCDRCVGLCCVAPAFGRSSDFALDKAAGVACPNLTAEHRCGIHDRLRPAGFAGCVTFDCFGAGQRVTQVTFGGRTDWRDGPEQAAAMFAAFAAARPLHELLRHLDEARRRATGLELAVAVDAVLVRVEAAAALDGQALALVDVDELRGQVAPVLRRVSTTLRAGLPQAEVDLSGADLVGADLRGRALAGADLRGALAMGADLRGADLQEACLLGTDLRGARLHGADLDGALFLTGPQLRSALGDERTRLPELMDRPAHW